jgi:hypothetical protein
VPPAETFVPLAETIVHTSEAAVKSAAVKPAAVKSATVKSAAVKPATPAMETPASTPAMPSVGEI